MNNFIIKISPIPKWLCTHSTGFFMCVLIYLTSTIGFQVQANPDDWPVYEAEFVVRNESLAPLPCYGSVNLSLDKNGKATVTPAMIISDKLPTYAQFKVVVLETGKNTVDCNDIGKSRSVKVTDTITGNSCWALLVVEDKLMPQLICNNDTLSCTVDPFLVLYEDLISIMDNCDNRPKIQYGLNYQKLNCDPLFSSIMNVQYIVTDRYGNSASCSKSVYFMKIPLDSIVFPLDDTLYCPVILANTGEPSYHGQPINALCDILSSHNDDTIQVCGGMFKIRRKWVIMDWCLRLTKLDTQEILIADTSRPKVLCPKDTLLLTSSQGCTASYRLPNFTAIDVCSPSGLINYIVRVDLSYIAKPGQTINLSLGNHILQYIAFDPCGNSDTCSANVTVIDHSAPSIVCPPKLILSLGANGEVKINTIYLNKYLYYTDNCGVDTVLIRRMTSNCGRPQDTIFRDAVCFCCNDLGTTQQIVLKVVDESGNANFCMIQIEVQNKNAYTVNCPGDITVNCDVDIYNLNNTGKPIVSNICLNNGITITYIDDSQLDSCKTGNIRRKFYINLANGEVDSSCIQSIVVVNPLTTPIIDWPSDTLISACTSNNPDSIGSFPIVINDPCKTIQFTYRDSMIAAGADSCQRFLRLWESKAICGFLAYKDTQEIKLLDFSAPKFTGPKDTFHCVDNVNCSPFISLQAIMVTSCNSIKSITNDYNSNGADASDVYPIGRHIVIFTIIDSCNHIVRDTLIVEVVDKISPIIGCRTITRNIEINDSAKVIARDLLIPNYSDNCTASGDLIISFNPNDPNDSCRYIPCTLHKQFPDSLWPFTVFVKDLSGNLAQCNGRLNVDDPSGFCNNLIGEKHKITGLIRSSGNKPMPNVLIQEEISNKQISTKEDGSYEFDNLNQRSKIELKPTYNKDWLEGINTLDIVRIQKHILGVDLFTHPFEWIAADVNKDGRVTTFDISLLRRLILGNVDEISGNSSWRFIPKNYSFVDLDYPLNDSIPNSIKYDSIDNDVKVDFTCIKIGDVSGAMGINNNQLSTRSRFYSFYCNNDEIRTDYKCITNFYAAEDLTMEGFQLKFQLESELGGVDRVLEYISSNQGNALNDEQIKISESFVCLSMTNKYPIRINKGTKVFSIVWNANRPGRVSDFIRESAFHFNEIYTSGYSTYPLNLRINNSTLTSLEPEIEEFRYAPNPFSEVCRFSFLSNVEVDSYFEISGQDGKVYFSKWKPTIIGRNQLEISATELSGPGIYNYKFVVGDYLKKGKIVLSK